MGKGACVFQPFQPFLTVLKAVEEVKDVVRLFVLELRRQFFVESVSDTNRFGVLRSP